MKLSSKNLFWSLLNLVLILALIFGVKSLVYKSFYKTDRQITVQGEGRVFAPPDIAKISFSVVSEGKEPALIQIENTEKVNKAIELLKLRGVSDADIKTTGYNLFPIYDYPVVSPSGRNRTPFITGYRLTQTILAKIRDLGVVGNILSGLPGNGVNQIDTISFEIDEPETYLSAARGQAFDKARAKAEAMARQAGVRLGKVVTFSESSGGPVPYYLERAAFGGGDAVAPAPVPQIEPGTQEVTIAVNVTYAIR